jgi:hypothetical protein
MITKVNIMFDPRRESMKSRTIRTRRRLEKGKCERTTNSRKLPKDKDSGNFDVDEQEQADA